MHKTIFGPHQQFLTPLLRRSSWPIYYMNFFFCVQTRLIVGRAQNCFYAFWVPQSPIGLISAEIGAFCRIHSWKNENLIENLSNKYALYMHFAYNAILKCLYWPKIYLPKSTTNVIDSCTLDSPWLVTQLIPPVNMVKISYATFWVTVLPSFKSRNIGMQEILSTNLNIGLLGKSSTVEPWNVTTLMKRPLFSWPILVKLCLNHLDKVTTSLIWVTAFYLSQKWSNYQGSTVPP